MSDRFRFVNFHDLVRQERERKREKCRWCNGTGWRNWTAEDGGVATEYCEPCAGLGSNPTRQPDDAGSGT